MSQGVTQGVPLSPRIFNVVVGVIVRNWAVKVAENESGPDSFGYMVAYKEEIFYSDNVMLDSTNPVWLKWVSDILIGLF